MLLYHQMKLSVIIPCHNEEKYIEKVLTDVNSLELPCEKEIIAINDGSDDNTKALLKKLKGGVNFKLLEHNKNLGKGTAIKTGLGITTGDLIIIQDADLEYDPADIPFLLKKMEGDVWAVYGNRGIKRWPKRGFHYMLGAKALTFLVNFIYRSNLHDVYTGYKLFNLNKTGKELFKNIKSSGFEFEAEITCKILEIQGKIIEVPINYTPRNKAEGKHIGLRDAFKGFFTIMRCFAEKK